MGRNVHFRPLPLSHFEAFIGQYRHQANIIVHPKYHPFLDIFKGFFLFLFLTEVPKCLCCREIIYPINHVGTPQFYVENFFWNHFLNLVSRMSTLLRFCIETCFICASLETTWSWEGSGRSQGTPASEADQRSRGGGEESSRAQEGEEYSDRPLQRAAGQRAAGIVSTAHRHTYTNYSGGSQQMYFRRRWFSTLR